MKGIILCGGSGTRLWPISRTLYPKQFVKLFDDKSLFQLTVERNADLCKSFLIVSNAEQYFLTIDQLEELNIRSFNVNNSRFLLEPVGRNTAPAIALACLSLSPDEIVLVSPSDHLIKNIQEYKKTIANAETLAKEGYLVTFGITPSYPETGYGYIQARCKDAKSVFFDVEMFHEKPDLETATKYLEENSKFNTQNSKLFFWNSGMFMFKAGVFLAELKAYAPEIYEACVVAFNEKKVDNSTIMIQHQHMETIPSESIDYAVMEKSKNVKVVKCDFSWNDLGSFASLYNEFQQDEHGNALMANATPVLIDSKNNLIISEDRFVGTIGVNDLIIVDTNDALLVAKKEDAQKVKELVSNLNSANSNLLAFHNTVHRPWGTYTVLEDGKGYKIKKIMVKPGKRLSLQKHMHRNEHWIVVSGTATVTVGNETRYVRPNESTYIKMGEVHRLANDGKIPVILIEAQVGEYTDEDDIVRIDDDFKRE